MPQIQDGISRQGHNHHQVLGGPAGAVNASTVLKGFKSSSQHQVHLQTTTIITEPQQYQRQAAVPGSAVAGHMNVITLSNQSNVGGHQKSRHEFNGAIHSGAATGHGAHKSQLNKFALPSQ